MKGKYAIICLKFGKTGLEGKDYVTGTSYRELATKLSDLFAANMGVNKTSYNAVSRSFTNDMWMHVKDNFDFLFKCIDGNKIKDLKKEGYELFEG